MKIVWKWIVAIIRWVGGLFQSCRNEKGPIDWTDRRFYIIGHRGSPAFEVENTLPSFQRAMEIDGATALELDICMSSDGQLVVWHDWDPDAPKAMAREKGLEPGGRYRPAPPEGGFRRRLSRLTLDEIRANFGFIEKESGRRVKVHILTYGEFLQWAVGCSKLELVFFDIKIPEDELEIIPRFMDEVERALERFKPRFRYVFETGEPSVLMGMKRERPNYEYSLDIEPPAGIVLFPEKYSCADAAICRGNSYATANRPWASTLAPWATFRRIVQRDLKVCLDHNKTNPERCLEAIVGYTINDEEEMECMIRSGIHGIQTDRPDLLRAVVDRLGMQHPAGS
jgi:glycerophosphoryl diester phosphodiesterase